MRKIFILSVLFCSFYSNAQNNFIEYQGIQKILNAEESIPEVKQIIEDANKEEFLCLLTFNENESHFKRTNEKAIEDRTTSDYLNIAAFNYKPYYYFKNENIYYYVYQNFIIKEQRKFDWQITSETKKIENFTCYKATFEEKYINRANEEKTRLITAWFCPQIPYSFGPGGYSGLPGIILELEFNGYKYVAKKITLNKDVQEISLPKLKTITKEEYSKKLLENLPD